MNSTTNDTDTLLAALDTLARLVAQHVVQTLTSGDMAGWVDQGASPLGRRRHCAAVRRHVAAGDGKAAVVGRRHLLSADALREELAAASVKQPRQRKKAEAKPTMRQQLADELGLQVLAGGGR